MESGYLIIETSERHPGLVRLCTAAGRLPRLPESAAEDPRIRYLAGFNDVDAALMHAHNALRHRLVNADTRLYRVELPRAIAAVESITLPHRRNYLDPWLEPGVRETIDAMTAAHAARQRQRARIWNLVGWIALALLAAQALTGFL
ncbi:MAG: hypothetical protein PHF72_06815 [Gammaproteobacteria bacterium]|nr:hypothetical protein [Gammaproteobacteria bacterium]